MNTKSRAAMIRKIERRIRAKYIKRCWLCFMIALLIGLAAGIYLCQWGPLKTLNDFAQDSHGPSVTMAPTPTQSAEATQNLFATPVATETPALVITPSPTPVVTATPAQTESAPSVQPEDTTTAAPVEATTPVEAATPTAVAAAVPTTAATEMVAMVEVTPAAPTAVDADGNVMGTIENPIPMGEAYTFDTEIVQGGTPRYDASISDFDTVSLSVSLHNYLTPDYFMEKYSMQYKLTGSEAGAELEFVLANNTGSQIINPQDMVEICFESEAGDIAQGYQLMSEEIAGDYGVPLQSGAPQTYYKRFAYTRDPEMAFLTITHYVGGHPVKVYFSLTPAEGAAAPTSSPAPVATVAVTYPSLEIGAEGDAVQKLQERLVELGYLEGDADGKFGAMTQTAISAAQEKGGMEATGVADNDFQQYIYSDSAKAN